MIIILLQDKEVTTCDENNGHDIVLTNQSTRHNDNVIGTCLDFFFFFFVGIRF